MRFLKFYAIFLDFMEQHRKTRYFNAEMKGASLAVSL